MTGDGKTRDQFIITPLPTGVRVVVNGVTFFKPYTAEMLLAMGVRFIEAGRETLYSAELRSLSLSG